jgi:[acyl-carrier-protein] S-malonyltransferase
MGKIAFIYPGQGAQKIGMGKDFYETKPNARRIFDEADKVLDFDIKNICFEENELINNTKYTQAALVTTCLAITKEVENLVKGSYERFLKTKKKQSVLQCTSTGFSQSSI